MINFKTSLAFLASIALIFSCANPRKLSELESENEELKAENKECNTKLDSAQAKVERLEKRVKDLEEDVRNLKEDTSVLGTRYRKVQRLNDEVNRMYETLKKQYKEMLSTTSSEKEKVSRKLELKKRELNQKEKRLNRMADRLEEREENINELSGQLDEREKRIEKLQTIIDKKDELVNNVRDKIKEALLQFRQNDELSVEVKNGKVHVSLSEKLLFASGSITVDPNGKKALGKLAQVLKENPDIQIMVEGHTDNVPVSMHDKYMKDNWDLSVLRATSISRILIQDNNVDPKRIIAAGRSKYHPVASNDSDTGRRKNRRTEIILTPDLDKLFNLLQQ